MHKNCPAIAKVHKSYFIGGAYGESTEKRMMKEILRNGVVNGELQVPGVFSPKILELLAYILDCVYKRLIEPY